MYQGKLVEYGRKEDVIRHPREPYTRKLIGAVPGWTEIKLWKKYWK